MIPNSSAQLATLAAHLASRREAILEAWRTATADDPRHGTASSLTRAQLNDHIPDVLNAFDRRLRSQMDAVALAEAEAQRKVEDVKHGLQRWQQGYRLREVTDEWSHLHLCLSEEMEACAAAHPEMDRATMTLAHRELIQLIGATISESTAQYTRMEQLEAAGHARDLEQALSQLSEIEKRRKALIRQVVHDLGGNVQAVSSAAFLLGDSGIPEAERLEYSELLLHGVASLRTMLGDMMSLARLEAGEEKREVENFNAAETLTAFCTLTQALAVERGLTLRHAGPQPLLVSGDPGKLRRIVQNLVNNALKYTIKGGVTVSWGEENALSWWVKIQDTGPGFKNVGANPMIAGLRDATASARESDQKAIAAHQQPAHVIPPAQASPGAASGGPQQPGEGIGLSIVKRLCELLDASIEFSTSAQTGTTFRILLPRNYSEG